MPLTKIYFLLVLVLGLRISWYYLGSPQTLPPGTSVSLPVVLDREPEVAYGKQLLRVNGLVVYAPIVPELHFGDRLVVSGLIECSKKGQDCSRLRMNNPEVEVIGTNSLGFWTTAGGMVRSQFTQTYQGLFSREQASLLSGIVLGNIGLDREFKSRLANVGLTHVVAASGMNISLFSGFVLWSLSGLKWHRMYKAILVVIAILFYSTVTGFEPPIVRAAIMAIFAVLGVLLGRQKSGMAGLLLAAYLMLWASPRLLTSASFLLSFSAMTGQVILSNLRLNLPKLVDMVMENFLQSLTAIVFTFPIVMVFFARFSLVSVFTNGLVLWTIEPLMVLGGVAGILGALSLDVSRLVAIPARVLLDYFLGVVNYFGRDESFLLRMAGINWAFVLGYYLVLGSLFLAWSGEKREVS